MKRRHFCLHHFLWLCHPWRPVANQRCWFRWWTNSYLCVIREAMFSFSSVGEVRGQGTLWMHAESHQRDLTWKHLEGHVLLCWLHSDLFLFRPVGLFLHPWGHHLALTPAWSFEDLKTWVAAQEVVCEEDVITGSEISLGRSLSLSCSYTLLFVSKLILRQRRYPDRLGLSHWTSASYNLQSADFFLLTLHKETVEWKHKETNFLCLCGNASSFTVLGKTDPEGWCRIFSLRHLFWTLHSNCC